MRLMEGATAMKISNLVTFGMMLLASSSAVVLAASRTVMAAFGGTIAGTVYCNDTPLRATFVRIQNDDKHINIHVLSDKQGHYRVENVLPGTYQVFVSSLGYDSETKTGVSVVDGQSVAVDLKANKGPLRWDELSTYQGIELLPVLVPFTVSDIS